MQEGWNPIIPAVGPMNGTVKIGNLFPNLWAFSERQGFDFYACKNLIDEFFHRELECECEILCGDKEIRRRELEKFGVYFSDPGRRDVDVI